MAHVPPPATQEFARSATIDTALRGDVHVPYHREQSSRERREEKRRRNAHAYGREATFLSRLVATGASVIYLFTEAVRHTQTEDIAATVRHAALHGAEAALVMGVAGYAAACIAGYATAYRNPCAKHPIKTGAMAAIAAVVLTGTALGVMHGFNATRDAVTQQEKTAPAPSSTMVPAVDPPTTHRIYGLR